MRLRSFYILIIFVLLVATACNFPTTLASAPQTSGSPVALAYLLVTADPHALPTATPFQPIGPTSTYDAPPSPTPTATATSTSTPTATEIPPTSTPEITQAQGTVNILLLGSDARPNEGGYRTDIIIWLSLNPKKGTATLLSFPRDLWVDIPGWGNQRINTAQVHGFATTQATFQSNFGIKPDYYVIVNFSAFETIIDTLGGIDVVASQNLTDSCDLPQAQNGVCSFGPGTIHMNGATALWYARSRYSTSDFDRTRRAQEVIIAIFKRMMSLDVVTKVPDLYAKYKNAVDTNIPLTTILSLLPMASNLTDTNNIRRFAIGPAQVYNWTTPDGAMVLVPIQSACMEVIRQAFTIP
jgi:LCP family protein required for cell wall assembly